MARRSTGRKAGKHGRQGSGSKAGKVRSSHGGRARSEETSGDRQKARPKKRAQASKKGGCLPKLFMLTLPFAFVGTFLVLKS